MLCFQCWSSWLNSHISVAPREQLGYNSSCGTKRQSLDKDLNQELFHSTFWDFVMCFPSAWELRSWEWHYSKMSTNHVWNYSRERGGAGWSGGIATLLLTGMVIIWSFSSYCLVLHYSKERCSIHIFHFPQLFTKTDLFRHFNIVEMTYFYKI